VEDLIAGTISSQWIKKMGSVKIKIPSTKAIETALAERVYYTLGFPSSERRKAASNQDIRPNMMRLNRQDKQRLVEKQDWRIDKRRLPYYVKRVALEAKKIIVKNWLSGKGGDGSSFKKGTGTYLEKKGESGRRARIDMHYTGRMAQSMRVMRKR